MPSLAPIVCRPLLGRVLTPPPSYNVTPEELFDLFGKYGPIRCVKTPLPRPLGGSR